MAKEKKPTGYPSIDKPWLKYYEPGVDNLKVPEETLYSYAYHCNENHMEETAFRYFGTKITYKKLFLETKRVALASQKAGVEQGDVVTIMSMHTPKTIYAYFALNYLGAIANMVYMTLSESEIATTLMETRSKVFLFLETAAERVQKATIPSDCKLVKLSVSASMPLHVKIGYSLKNKGSVVKQLYCENFADFVKHGQSVLLREAANDAHAPAVIVYTSGTTGEPKGVVLSSYNLNSVAFQYKYSKMQFNRGETYLDIIPLFLAYGVAMLQLAVTMGIDSTLWIVPEPKQIAGAFEKTKPNHFASGPAMLDDIMKNVTGDMSYLINFTGGGAALSPEKEAELNCFLDSHNCHVKYAIGYGMTELAASVCANNNAIYRQGSLGIPLPKSIAKIIDTDTDAELKIGETGEICFCSPSVMLGYYHNKAATAEIMKTDTEGKTWIHTGDLGYIDEDGFLFYQGKRKRIYVCRTVSGLAVKLFPQRIEELFETNPLVDKCAAVVVEDEMYLHVVHVYVSCKSPVTENGKLINELEEKAKKELPEHSQPASIKILQTIPLTASGKVDYRALEELAKKT